MKKLSHPFSWYYKKLVIEEECPLCKSTELHRSDADMIVWCSGYGRGGYLTSANCETYAADAFSEEHGHCYYCRSGDSCDKTMVKNHLVIICDHCDKVFDFQALQIYDQLFSELNPSGQQITNENKQTKAHTVDDFL